MILPVTLLLFAALVVYSGIQDKPVTDILRSLLGRASKGSLGNLSGNSPTSNSANPTVAGGSNNNILGSSSVPGHPELKPKISAVVNAILAQYPYLVITSTTRGGHAANSYHYKGEAADLAGLNMDAIGSWIAQTLGTQLTEGIHNPTLSIKNGQTVPPSFWGATTWAAHTNHIHVAVAE